MLRPILAAIAFVFCLVAVVAGQDGNGTVREIRIVNAGPGKIDESFVMTHVRTRAGDAPELSLVDKDVKKLLGTGRFSDVRVEAETTAGGVRLNYILRNKYILAAPVVVSGADRYSADRIRDILGLEPSDLVDDQVMGVRVQKLLAAYRDDHYADSSATWKIAEADREVGTAMVSVEVNEGRKATVADIAFTGNESIPSKQLRETMKHADWWNPFSWFGSHKYEADELELARIQMREIYGQRGYLDVQVGAPVVTRDADGDMLVSFNIVEGPRYSFGKITIEGNTLFPDSPKSEIRNLIKPLKTGEQASAMLIDSCSQAIRDYYGSRGYVSTVVRAARKTDPEKKIVDIVFNVTEGKLMKIRNIYIKGNSRTRDKVIRRELKVVPGQIYDEVAVRRSERVVQNLGFFTSVRSYPEETRYDDQSDLVMEVEEGPSGNLMMGMGFSSVENLTGYIEISQNNFDLFGWPYVTGGGQKLKLRAEMSSVRKDYEIDFIEPWFLDRRLSLGLSVFSTEADYSDYDVRRIGGAISLGVPLQGRSNRMDVKYRLEKVRLSNISDTNEYVYVDPPQDVYFYSDEARDTRQGTLSVTLSHDERNNPLIPTSGYHASLQGSIAADVLGSEVDIYSVAFRTSAFLPLWKNHYLGFHMRAQVVDSYSDSDSVPLSDRLFLGGGNTIRGLEYRDVGPKVVPVDAAEGSDVHRTVGGSSLLLGALEYNIPIVDKIRFAAFVDAGNVWRDAFDFRMDELAVTTGCGIRFDVPGFPIKIDRAWVLRKDSNLTDSEVTVFWIGPTF